MDRSTRPRQALTSEQRLGCSSAPSAVLVWAWLNRLWLLSHPCRDCTGIVGSVTRGLAGKRLPGIKALSSKGLSRGCDFVTSWRSMTANTVFLKTRKALCRENQENVIRRQKALLLSKR
jgi:hypothetical protein